MERSSREWDISKEMEGDSYYICKDTVQEKPRKRKTKSDCAAKH